MGNTGWERYIAEQENIEDIKIRVVEIEHVAKDAEGNIKRGDSCVVPCGKNPSEVMSIVENEIEMMVVDHPDTMILLTTRILTEKELEEAGEFQGW